MKVLAEYGRNQDSNITRLSASPTGCPSSRCPIWPTHGRVEGRRARATTTSCGDLTNALRVEGDRRTSRRSTRTRSAGSGTPTSARRRSCSTASCGAATTPTIVPRLVRWLLARARTAAGATRRRTRPRSSRSCRYYRKFESETPDMTATVAAGRRRPSAPRRSRAASSTAQADSLAMPDLLAAGRRRHRARLAIARDGAGHALLQHAPAVRADRCRRRRPTRASAIERRYEKFVESGDAARRPRRSAPAISIRVTLTLTLPQGTAASSPSPTRCRPASKPWTAGSARRRRTSRETHRRATPTRRLDGVVATRRLRSRREVRRSRRSSSRRAWAKARHEFSYIVRATTSGTFRGGRHMGRGDVRAGVNGRTATRDDR